MKKRSDLSIMLRLIKLVRPLTGYMTAAVAMGVAGFLCAQFITILGGYAMLDVLKIHTKLSLTAIFVTVILLAVLRAVLKYGEQSANHFIALQAAGDNKRSRFQGTAKALSCKA